MQRCPHCRARCNGTARCRRCGAGLEKLLQIERQADQLARQAVACLGAGDITGASSCAGIAMRLHATPFNRALVGFIGSLAGHPDTIAGPEIETMCLHDQLDAVEREK